MIRRDGHRIPLLFTCFTGTVRSCVQCPVQRAEIRLTCPTSLQASISRLYHSYSGSCFAKV